MGIRVLFHKVIKYITQKKYRITINNTLGFYRFFSDKHYLEKIFPVRLGYSLNLESPSTFNEKLQWMKLYNRKSDYTMMVDKYRVRSYVQEKIGEEYLIPLLGVWDTPEQIDFTSLPLSFVLKCNHNSGTGMCICINKNTLDDQEVKKQLNKGLKENYYLIHREWPYKNVPRKILAEKFMGNPSHKEGLMDYKFMCFSGKVQCSFVCTERFSDTGLKVTFFDREWNRMPFERHFPSSSKVINKPINYEKMIQLAEILSAGIPFVRVDFYEIEGKIYFGEMTFFPGSGFEEFSPLEWDYKLGSLIDLPSITLNK